MNAKISVCVPVYNGVKYLAETIDSVLAQDEAAFELVIQDNCSTDGTWQMVEAYAAKDARIQPARNPATVDMASNWNLAINRARASLIMLLSADDLLKPGYVRVCLDALQISAVDAASTNHSLLNGAVERRRRVLLKEGIYTLSAALILGYNPFSINFTVFRRQTIDRLRRSDGQLFTPGLWTCDYDLWLRIAKMKGRIRYLGDTLATYRVHEQALSAQRIEMIRQTRTVLRIHRCWILRTAPFSIGVLYARLGLRHLWALRAMVRFN